MKTREFSHIIAAVLMLTIIGSFAFIINNQWNEIPIILFFAVIIIFLTIFVKKLVALWLDCDVEHEFWKFSRYWIKPGDTLDFKVPAGIIFPLIFSIFSLGWIKFATFLTYETTALKKRAAKKFGMYSYSEITDWHNGLIGAAGIVACFLIAIIAYFASPNLEPLAELSIFYALSNMIPLSKLDGNQILFGSVILYAILLIISLILGYYAWII